MTLHELQLPSIASLRAIAALRSPHLSLVRPARIGLGFESAGANQKTLAEIEDLLGGPGRLSLPYSLRWLLDVLAGLGVLHRGIGFVHGEVQPEHLVLGEDGVGRLMPVVRAHWVRGEQRSPGRLYYLAPEKLLGDTVDVRSDVFSVGVLLWEAVAGQRLFEATSVGDIIARLMGGGIPLAQAPEGEAWTVPLAHVAERAISVDPSRRFSSIAEVKEAIEAVCLRYLASTPGMAQLFEDPQRRARSATHDPVLPDSQRVTLPPVNLNEEVLDAAADRLSRSSFSSIDLDGEAGVASSLAPSSLSHDVPISWQAPLNPARVVEPAQPDSVAKRVPTPAWQPTAPASDAPRAASDAPRAASDAPRAASDAPRAASLAPRAASLAPRAASLAPLVAARPTHAALDEPEFELRKPRKGRGMLWLMLGASVAVAGLALRPWLAEKLAAPLGVPAAAERLPKAAPTTHEAPSSSAAMTAAAPQPSNTRPAVGIASTPASPEDALGVPSHAPLSARPEARVTPRNNPKPEPRPQPPGANVAKPEPTPIPAKTVPAPKALPVSEAERYGI